MIENSTEDLIDQVEAIKASARAYETLPDQDLSLIEGFYGYSHRDSIYGNRRDFQEVRKKDVEAIAFVEKLGLTPEEVFGIIRRKNDLKQRLIATVGNTADPRRPEGWGVSEILWFTLISIQATKIEDRVVGYTQQTLREMGELTREDWMQFGDNVGESGVFFEEPEIEKLRERLNKSKFLQKQLIKEVPYFISRSPYYIHLETQSRALFATMKSFEPVRELSGRFELDPKWDRFLNWSYDELQNAFNPQAETYLRGGELIARRPVSYTHLFDYSGIKRKV